MNRKEMIEELSEHLQATPKYLGAPSFAYQIKTATETYIIDREGTIRTAEGQVMALEDILQSKESETKTLISLAEVTLPMTGHSGATLQNMVNMLFSKQHLIMMAFESEAPFMDDAFAADLDMKKTLSIADFQSALAEIDDRRCPGLSFDFENETFTFKLTAEGLTPEKVAAFTDLAALLSESAKSHKRASYKPVQIENPKYALRTWLLRLGMIGDAYKKTRKVLLANLPGSSAFRNCEKGGQKP